MQKWLDDNDILMYLTHNKVNSVVAERFIRTLKGKIYRKFTANDNKSYLGYLNKLKSNYATKIELEHAAGVNTSDLAAKKILLL